MSEANVPTEQPPAGQAPRLPPPDVHPGREGHLEGPPAEGAPPSVGLIWRVDRRSTFEALRRGRRAREGPLSVSWVPGDPAEPPRVAFTIGRRVGTAVVRNRLRRRLRMIMRTAAPGLRPGAYLLTAAPEAARLPFRTLQTTVIALLQKIS
jgi:ribonuclease P protein component